MAIKHSLYEEGGSVTVDESTCTRCGECVRICSGAVLRLEEGGVRIQAGAFPGCIACGHCMMVCPTGSIRVEGRGLSPADLVPLAPLADRADAKALSALMMARRSVRRFSADEPSLDLLRQVIAMASSGPMGIPPWDVGCVVVRGRPRVQALAAQVVAGYAGMLKLFKPWMLELMRPFMGRPAYEQMKGFVFPLASTYVEGRRQGQDHLFYDAPAVLLFHHSPYADAAEAMIACTYAMLAAESLGLGSTMIGAAAPMISRNRKLCRRLGIPAGNKPAIALVVGYPAVHFRRGITRRFSSVVISDSGKDEQPG